MESKYIQASMLIEYGPSLLNADENGLQKKISFGDCIRCRVSSQCLKHHWRRAHDQFSLMNIAPDPVRTRKIASGAIMTGLAESLNVSTDTIEVAVKTLEAKLYGGEDKESDKKQPQLFGQKEINFLKEATATILKEHQDPESIIAAIKYLFDVKNKNNFSAFRTNTIMPAGIIGATFGRMTTADLAANIEAAVYVAHAITVHEQQTELDFFTAMEEIGNSPAAFMGTSELSTGIYYVYFCINVPDLVCNTTHATRERWSEADVTVAAKTASELIKIAATESPGAKRGSTAPFSWASAMVVEIGDSHPISWVSAFSNPVEPIMDKAEQRLCEYIESREAKYPNKMEQRMYFGDQMETRGTKGNLIEITDWVEQAIMAGTV